MYNYLQLYKKQKSTTVDCTIIVPNTASRSTVHWTCAPGLCKQTHTVTEAAHEFAMDFSTLEVLRPEE